MVSPFHAIVAAGCGFRCAARCWRGPLRAPGPGTGPGHLNTAFPSQVGCENFFWLQHLSSCMLDLARCMLKLFGPNLAFRWAPAGQKWVLQACLGRKSVANMVPMPGTLWGQSFDGQMGRTCSTKVLQFAPPSKTFSATIFCRYVLFSLSLLFPPQLQSTSSKEGRKKLGPRRPKTLKKSLHKKPPKK